MKKLLFFVFLFLAFSSNTQITLVPDVNFEQALIDLGYDTGSTNGSIPTANINSVASLDVYNSNITDLTGIQAFAALTFLNCGFNQLTALDVSQNSALAVLYCDENQLTSLDLTFNPSLTFLVCALNQLTYLDVTQNTALTDLYCDENQLTFLDVSQNIALSELGCSTNLLTSLDVSQNSSLTELSCHSNKLSSLDISQNTALTLLRCDNNFLTSLDVFQNTGLTFLWCKENQLECLNVKNGNNNLLATFNASLNPSLLCIEVDDVSWSNSNWTFVEDEIDSQTTFSNNCGNSCSLDVNQINLTNIKKLSKIVDLTGREVQYKKNTLMLHIYEDGTSEKVLEFE